MIDAGAGGAGRQVGACIAETAVALARCAVRAVAVNAVAVVVAPFLAACNDPAFASPPTHRPGATRASTAGAPTVRRGGVIPADYKVTLRDGAEASAECAGGLAPGSGATRCDTYASSLD
jgi:hypothetical protein